MSALYTPSSHRTCSGRGSPHLLGLEFAMGMLPQPEKFMAVRKYCTSSMGLHTKIVLFIGDAYADSVANGL